MVPAYTKSLHEKLVQSEEVGTVLRHYDKSKVSVFVKRDATGIKSYTSNFPDA